MRINGRVSPDGHSTDKVSELIEREIRQIGIPPCPQILIRIHQEMNKDEPSYPLLTSIISADVALAASLIKTANSPGLGMRTRVRSAGEALLALGLKVTGITVANFALREIFPRTTNMERFWDFSSRIAQMSGWLARRVGDIRPDDAYTFSLFRDCGIPILMIPFEETYPKVLHQANEETERSFTDVENELLGINHAAVGADLAESWLLPQDMSDAIRHHHSLRGLQQESGLAELPRKLIAISQLAEHLIQFHTGLSHTKEWAKVGPSCLEYLNISDSLLMQMYEESKVIVGKEF
jgi:HD-like signal output (HDOD) protein